jgi:hypothetical protein
LILRALHAIQQLGATELVERIKTCRRADLSTRKGHRAAGLVVDETRSVTDYTGYPEII